ncbi:MAG: hypothetical protein Q8R57_01080 [Bacteroidota bacterium]|nr:hypothetical protein [Bacteroidota bacterium]
MKKMRLLAIASLALMAQASSLLAQNNVPQDTATIVVPNQQMISQELQKFGMKLFEFPAGQICPTAGPARIHDYPVEGVNPPNDNPTLKFGDFTPGLGKDRDINIIWLHGLNGNTDSWNIAAHATQFGYAGIFPARKARSVRGSASSAPSHPVQFYSETSGIVGAARDLENEVPLYINNTSKTQWDYIIAHSQGGIVAREWLRQMDQSPATFKNYAHGLVTFGTPHTGAEIINNTRPTLRNKLPAFFKEACVALGGAVVTPKINSNFLTRFLVSNNMKQVLTNATCGLSSDLIIPYALDNYFKSTTNDFFVGAPFLEGTPTNQGLSQYELKVPVVQFFGIEQQPVMWRFMSSSLNIGHDYLDENQKIFGYDQDDQLQIKVQDMINEFDAKAIYEDREAEFQRRLEIGYYASALFNPLFLPLAVLAGNKKNAAIENKHAYVKAKNWLADANEVYQIELLGDKKTQMVVECHLIEELDCYDPIRNPKGFMPPVKLTMEQKYRGVGAFCTGPSIADKYTNFEFPGNDGTMWRGNCEGTQLFLSYLKLINVPLASDGVVLANSASNRIKVKSGNTHAIRMMPETNHDQMKNSSFTKFALNDLYDGKLGDFFSIQLR